MTDRELLQKAAKTAGYALDEDLDRIDVRDNGGGPLKWNPLDDDGDALRLAVRLRLNLAFEEWDGAEYACAVPRKSHQGHDEVIGDDDCADTRRAIVIAAAALADAPGAA